MYATFSFPVGVSLKFKGVALSITVFNSFSVLTLTVLGPSPIAPNNLISFNASSFKVLTDISPSGNTPVGNFFLRNNFDACPIAGAIIVPPTKPAPACLTLESNILSSST